MTDKSNHLEKLLTACVSRAYINNQFLIYIPYYLFLRKMIVYVPGKSMETSLRSSVLRFVVIIALELKDISSKFSKYVLLEK